MRRKRTIERIIPEGYLSLQEASRMLGLTGRKSIYYLFRVGKLKRYRVHSFSVVKETDVKELLKPKSIEV